MSQTPSTGAKPIPDLIGNPERYSTTNLDSPKQRLPNRDGLVGDGAIAPTVSVGYNPDMDSVTIENYRCFRERQTARLAPLTLLVGENSAGKTSFLALLRALWDVAVRDALPDFRQEPYDLGAFSDVVYSDSSHNEQPRSFHAGFVGSNPAVVDSISFDATFEDVDGVIIPVSRRVSAGDAWIRVNARPGQVAKTQIGVGDRWQASASYDYFSLAPDDLFPIITAIVRTMHEIGMSDDTTLVRDTAERYSEHNPRDDKLSVWFTQLNSQWGIWITKGQLPFGNNVPFAGAPIRSSPKRTYDPSRPTTDPEGANVPTYLARLSRHESGDWKNLKHRLEQFGQTSGLFDEIEVETFGAKDDAAPFRIMVRKFGKRRKGLHRNMVDVGYGVSQALPVITELLRPDPPSLFLLQQPEVHLHPSAQAALGSLFCSVANPDRQIVVETHSDYIIDRVRMDVRDKTTDLKPEDVSILYFERGDTDVSIHSISIDEDGNVLGAPPGYRQFFSDELRRSIGI